MLQKKSLQSLYDDKVRHLVKKLLTLDGDSERSVGTYFHFFCFHWLSMNVQRRNFCGFVFPIEIYSLRDSILLYSILCHIEGVIMHIELTK